MILVENGYGGLCNRLFSLANQLAFSREAGERLHSIPAWDLQESFPGLSPTGAAVPPSQRWFWKNSCRLIRKSWKGIHFYGGEQDRLDLEAESGMGRSRGGCRPILLDGFYTVADEAFQQQADWLRKIFAPPAPVLQEVRSLVLAARQAGALLVGVHCRAGDYREFQDGLYFYDLHELRVQMEALQELLRDVPLLFMVCSNEEIDSEVFRGMDLVEAPGSVLGDLYGLAACDVLIGPSSTFTQWTSFYGKVPRYVVNWKAEQHFGVPEQPMASDRFIRLRAGFGTQAVDDPVLIDRPWADQQLRDRKRA